MRIGFVFGSPKISGGSYVIFQHAIYLKSRGHEVYILLASKNKDIYKYSWHEAFKVLSFSCIDEFNKELDLTIATWWESPYLLWKIRSKQYAYFVQSIEAYFFKRENLANQYIAHQSYFLGLPIITEATWIKEDLESKYIDNVFLVKNGILKHRYKPYGPVIDLPQKNKIRCLVEGPINVPFKAVKETIDALNKSNVDEIWLLTSSEINDYPNCDRVFSNIDPTDVPMIMRSCDVLVKQSAVEGMFGPPLEMFHCGGTCIVSNVTGYDEYIVDGKNALVNNIWDFEQVIRNVNLLKANPLFLRSLKHNALLTAKNWPDWNEQSKLFELVLNEIMALPRVDRNTIEIQTKRVYKFADFLRKSYSQTKTVANLPVRFEMSKKDMKFKNQFVTFNEKVKSKTKRILGLTISNEHIQELWHPLVKRLGFEYRYICTKAPNQFTLWDKSLAEESFKSINKDEYITFNWIKETKELFKHIESFAPDVILVHSGNHPAYQKILREINIRYQIPILFSELGWLPQKYNFYIDEIGTNAKSSIHSKSYEEFVGISQKTGTYRDFKNNNVLLILQLETDMNFIIDNPYFNSNEEFIKYVISCVPEEYNIIIKPHPLDNNSDRYLKFASNRVSISFDSFEQAIKNCNSIIGINSTCLIEALEYEVNIYKCGKSILDNKELTIDFTNRNLDKLWINSYFDKGGERRSFLKELKKYQINVTSVEKLTDEEIHKNKSIAKMLYPEYLELFDFKQNLIDSNVQHGMRLCCTSLEGLCKGLLDYDIISFDFFDTLARYEVINPTDLHKLVCIKVCEIVNSSKFDHYTYRVKAEEIVREYSLRDEVTLKEIYAQYLLLTGLPAAVIEKIKQLEINTTKSLIVVRNSGKKLFDFAKEAKKKICVTSDYFIGDGFIQECLVGLGYDLKDVEFFISADLFKSKKKGSTYQYIKNKFTNAKILHIGDNFKIDLQTAIENGINASHFPSILDTQKNSTKSFAYLEYLFNKQPLINYNIEMGLCLSEIISKRFDDPFKIDKNNSLPLQEGDIGYSLLGPFIFSFTSWLYKLAKRHNITHLLFLSRDGSLLKKAFEHYSLKNEDTITSKYVYCSRRAMNIINLSYDFSNIKEIVDTRLSRAPLSYFLEKRLSIKESELDNSVLRGTGFNSFEDLIQLPADKSRVLLLCQKIRNIIIDKSNELRRDYLKYLQCEILPINWKNEKVGVVDIGYFGSMQNSLSNLFKEIGFEAPRGFYIATRKEISFSHELSDLSNGFLSNKFSPTDIELPELCRRLGYLEFLLSAPHGSFEELKFYNGSFKLSLTSSDYEAEQWNRLKIIHMEALNFVEKLTAKERKLKQLGIEYFDASKIRFDRALSKFLDPNSSESRYLLKDFVLENLYSLEILPFYSNSKLIPQILSSAKNDTKKSESDRLNSSRINTNCTNILKVNNATGKMVVAIAQQPNVVSHNEVEPTDFQKGIINCYGVLIKAFAQKKFYLKYKTDTFQFFYDTKSPINLFIAKLINRFGNKIFICKHSLD